MCSPPTSYKWMYFDCLYHISLLTRRKGSTRRSIEMESEDLEILRKRVKVITSVEQKPALTETKPEPQAPGRVFSLPVFRVRNSLSEACSSEACSSEQVLLSTHQDLCYRYREFGEGSYSLALLNMALVFQVYVGNNFPCGWVSNNVVVFRLGISCLKEIICSLF